MPIGGRRKVLLHWLVALSKTTWEKQDEFVKRQHVGQVVLACVQHLPSLWKRDSVSKSKRTFFIDSNKIC